ncbi:carboxypeptidase_regulatory-like domain-containing protein [Hexamita inflata]|uniref:Carboxypeptidase regulatory-like domain-containing protein n=1 Tax=Hexamita inflata TaxID=28002 RepID=A0AA86V2K3_9EUKA|nr:carboxypeptidase regulatory-like domain-containing protein [Hexamita inflata]
MSISKIITYQENFQQICSNLLSRPIPIGYCVKEQSLSSRVQTANISHSPEHSIHFSLYTKQVQSLVLNLNYSAQNLPQFALFGLTANILMHNSNISVKVPQLLAQGSLICFICDMNASASDFLFIASGQNVSGSVLTPLTTFIMNKCFLQFRLNGQNVGGLVLNATQIVVSLIECNISSYIDQGSVSGSIIAFVYGSVLLDVDYVLICSNVQKIGNFAQGTISQTGLITSNCMICIEGAYTYGLCQNSLEYGKMENNNQICTNTFTFDGEKCSCKEGEVIYGIACVNILTLIQMSNNQQIEIGSSVKGETYKIIELEQTINNLQQNYTQTKFDVQNLYQLNNQTLNNIIYNYQLQEYNIQDNCTKADINLEIQSQILDNQIYGNISSLNIQFSTLNTDLTSLNQNITKLNETLIDQLTQNHQLSQNISQLGLSLKLSNEFIIQQKKQIKTLSILIQCLNIAAPGQCYVIQQENQLSCSSKIYSSSFDIQIVTNKISQDSFSADYVFPTQTIVQNAFIDLQDNIYTTVKPLFQSQSTFINLKIQFGTQIISGGSFILSSTATSIAINQMNIVSKMSKQIALTASQLNLITSTSINAVINNLLVNLSFSPSSGNISLINNIKGVFNISGYQVFGEYSSTLTVTMIGLNINTATVNINQMSFMPSSFNVGNGSSYLFGSSVGTKSTFLINNLALIIGNNSNTQLLASVTANTSSYYYLFGGVIALMSDSSINITNIILDSNQKFSSDYVRNNGFLVGYVQTTTSNITVTNVCLQQNIISTTIQFYYFGLIGKNSGNTYLQNLSVTLSVQGIYFGDFGIVGYQYYDSTYAEIKNLMTSTTLRSENGWIVGLIFGYESANNCSIQNAAVVGQNISSGQTSYIGGYIGFQLLNANLTTLDSQISEATFSGMDSIGGLIGRSQSSLYLININIKFVHIDGTGQHIGIVIGFSEGTYAFSCSSSSSNYINGVQQKDCAALSNIWSVIGCGE